MSSFHVDARICLKLEYEMAIRLGEMILLSGTVDKQLKALGHKLKNIDSEETDEFNSFAPSKESCDNFYKKSYQDVPYKDWDNKENSNSISKVSLSKKTRKIRWGMD